MKKYTISIMMLCIFFLLFISGCDSDKTEDNVRKFDSEHRAKIFLITKDKVAPYWSMLDEGCRQAVEELDSVDYEWRAPAERTVDEQIKCIDKIINDGADAILISTISQNELNAELEKADKAGIKIIYVDDAATVDCVATLMTDNKIAGETAGETMLRAFREHNITSGTVGIVGDIPGALNRTLREEGFRKAFADSNFTVAPTIYTGGNPQVAKDSITSRPDYIGFFGMNQTTTLLIAGQVKTLASGQIVVGFDVVEDTLKFIEDGTIYATMKQNTSRMGYEGIKIALSALNGRYNKKNVNIDTGVTVVTKENIEQFKN